MKTRTVGKHLLQMISFLALGAVAASAFSQSAEYRRGYDQGYRDGMAAKESGGRSGIQERSRMEILHARYGTRDAGCDARNSIRDLAGWSREIEFKVTNDLCGDPAEGRHKFLVVEYRCGDGPKKRAEAPESNTMSLHCR